MDKDSTVTLPTDRERLPVEMKLGILHTIADSTYDTTEGKIREAVANSKDNGASLFIIYSDPNSATLTLFDDGQGISRKKFEEIFTHLGYGLDRNQENSLSFFGLGLMSVIRLGVKATIITRTSHTSEILAVELKTGDIFNKFFEKLY